MNVYGVTPIDTALSVAGLNWAQLVMEFIFIKSGVGIVAAVLGYLWLMWRLTRTGKYGQIWVYCILALVLILLLLPSRSLTQYKSIQERYDVTALKATDIKRGFCSFDRIPNIYTYITHGADLIVFGIIAVIDKTVPEWARFLSVAQQIPQQSYYIREAVHQGFQDRALRHRFNEFITHHYLPVFARAKHESKIMSLENDGPSSKAILSYYSTQQKRQWQDLSRDINAYFNDDEQLNPRASVSLTKMMGITYEDLMALIVRSYARQLIGGSFHETTFNWFDPIFMILKIMPYIHGMAQISLAMTFPCVVLLVLIRQQLLMLAEYLRIFLWVKSWTLCIALSFYGGMLMAYIQSKKGVHIAWAWEYPYFLGAVVVFLGFTLYLTHSLILRGGRS